MTERRGRRAPSDPGELVESDNLLIATGAGVVAPAAAAEATSGATVSDTIHPTAPNVDDRRLAEFTEHETRIASASVPTISTPAGRDSITSAPRDRSGASIG